MKGIITGGSLQTVTAGEEILQQGGNAADAVVGAYFASTMGEICLASLSGGGFATVAPPNDEPILYDFFCDTPGKGDDRRGTDHFDFSAIEVIYESGTSIYHIGRGSTAVHGDVAGVAQLLADYGTMSLSDVIQPAIKLAREGYILNDYQAYLIRLIDVILEYDASCLRYFAPEGNWLNAGERFKNEDLAQTFEVIASDGWQAMYSGAIGQELVASHQASGGLLTTQDLADYQVAVRKPLTINYRGRMVYTNPPPSSGGALIAYALYMLEQADLSSLAHSKEGHAALLAEIERQVIMTRYRDLPSQLVEEEALNTWIKNPQWQHDWQAIKAGLNSGKPRQGYFEPPTHTSTTHISVIDETGLAIGLTTTPGETAGYMGANTGILMNNMLGEDELNPLGFHQYQIGRRLSSMMAPTIVTNEQGTTVVTGSGGAARLRGAIFQVLSNLLDWGMPIEQAVNASRIHLDKNTVHFEGGFLPESADAIEARGYPVNRWQERAFYFGGTHTAMRTPDGKLSAAGDPRRNGHVAIVD